jgi:hypothetical protein
MKTTSSSKSARPRLAKADPFASAPAAGSVREATPGAVAPAVDAEAVAQTDAPETSSHATEEAGEDRGFSAAFYVGFYNDLRDKTAKEAEIHWRTLGKFEGRFGGAQQVIDDFAARGSHLPTDFDAGLYRLLLHRTLRYRIRTDLDAAAHYIAVGRAAGLRYKPEDMEFFRALYFDDGSSYSRMALAAVRREEADIDQSAAALFARVGLRSTEFLRVFDVSDYMRGSVCTTEPIVCTISPSMGCVSWFPLHSTTPSILLFIKRPTRKLRSCPIRRPTAIG